MDENDEPSGSNTIESSSPTPSPPPNPFAFIRKLPPQPAPRDKNGHLLQHVRVNLYKSEIQKLKLSMQKFDSDSWNFSDKEDKKIRENWKRFKRKYELDGHIFQYCDYTFDEKWENIKLDPSWFFWPSICDGLPNRTAYTVRKRIFLIFDENYDPKGSYDVLEMKKLIKSKKSELFIADQLKIPLPVIKKAKQNNKSANTKDPESLKRAFNLERGRIMSRQKTLEKHLEDAEDDEKKRKILEKLEELNRKIKELYGKRDERRELLKSGESEDVVFEQLCGSKPCDKKSRPRIPDHPTLKLAVHRERSRICTRKHYLKKSLKEAKDDDEKQEILEKLEELGKGTEKLDEIIKKSRELLEAGEPDDVILELLKPYIQNVEPKKPSFYKLTNLEMTRLRTNHRDITSRLKTETDETIRAGLEAKLAQKEQEIKDFMVKQEKGRELQKAGKTAVEIAEELDFRVLEANNLKLNGDFESHLKDLDDQLQAVDDEQEKLKIQSKIRKLKERQRDCRNKTKHSRRHLIPEVYLKILRYLYRSVKTDSFVFETKAFDWDKFDAECDRANIAIPPTKSVIGTYSDNFKKANETVFRHLDPIPALKERIVIVYEALARWMSRVRTRASITQSEKTYRENGGKFTVPLLKPHILFSVLYEQYTKRDKSWKPPDELVHFLEEIDVEKVGKRVERAEKMQKREAERKRKIKEEPQSSLTIKTVQLRARSEGPPVKKVKFSDYGQEARSQEDMEISAIHNTFDANLTAISVTDVSASASFRADETILAGGGKRGRGGKRAKDIDSTGFESLLLPKIEESAKKKRKNEEKEQKFSLDESFANVWDQLLS